MDREPPPVTVTAPGSGGPPPDLLEGAPARPRRPRPAVLLALVTVAVLGAAALRGSEPAAPERRPAPVAPAVRTATSGIIATASLAGAATGSPYAQRLALTVDLPAFDGRGDSGGRLLGDEVLLVDVSARGFTVTPDDPRSPLPLGRFGRSTSGVSTTVPLQAVVDDCSIEPQARRDLVLSVRTGRGPDGAVRVSADADVVRALDALVSRTCRRPRG